MNRIPIKLAAVATTCAVAGAGAGAVLNASAADSTSSSHKAKAAKHHKKHKRGPLQRAVHAELTLPTKDGFKQGTIDRGFIKAISGNQITLSESTKKLPGKTVTLTVPGGARVHVDGKGASLSDVKVGQHAALIVLPKRSALNARTPK